MSSEKDYPNSGILFKSDQKRTQRDRDYKGTADIDCPHCGARSQFWLSAWVKQGKAGKFMSLAFKGKDGATADRQSAPGGGGVVAADDDSDIPFVTWFDVARKDFRL